jgi:hypothetical protein
LPRVFFSSFDGDHTISRVPEPQELTLIPY